MAWLWIRKPGVTFCLLHSLQALIRALAEYEGGVMIVSHDEHLITAVSVNDGRR